MSVDPPPSEDVMAAWLYPIVSGQDLDGDCLKQPVAKEASETSTMAMRSLGTTTAEGKEGLPATDGMSGAKVGTWARPVYRPAVWSYFSRAMYNCTYISSSSEL
jgi:hypothetical protein